ncbi:hypothetical protein CVT24_013033 [Panaeolus cyanescens]|uniref:RNase H type-1 domain-containing protein n=1 Tax=Panaeolus cyanescens TaxID=181874 RepID=A0A409YUQ8_9AGAR|nr:hypothetical protein CVT24_013033 [Panaeolus cyanescens]
MSEDGEPPTLHKVWESWAPVGCATSVDAELAGICVALCKALALPGCNAVYLFSNCLPALRLATDCTEYGGQQHSLAIVQTLSGWLPESANHCIYLIHSPSCLKWGPQGEAHELLQACPQVAVGCHARTILTWLCDFADHKALDLWNARFSDEIYRGKHFLPLQDAQDRLLRPTTKKGGLWLPAFAGGYNSHSARMGHTPIGEYYHWFNIPESTQCVCGRFGSQDHILGSCRKFTFHAGYPYYVWDLDGFLFANRRAFSFSALHTQRPRDEEGIG